MQEPSTTMKKFTPPRRYRREHVEWKASWNVFGRLEEGVIADVSPGGAFIATPRGATLRPGARVQLWFKLGNRPKTVHVTCTVRWSGQHRGIAGFGVQFDQVQLGIGAALFSPEAEAALQRLRQQHG